MDGKRLVTKRGRVVGLGPASERDGAEMVTRNDAAPDGGVRTRVL